MNLSHLGSSTSSQQKGERKAERKEN